MKRLLLLLLVPLCLYGQTFDQKVREQLEKDKKVIQAFNDLRVKQLEAMNEFLRKGPTTELTYDGVHLNVKSVSEIKVYDINAETLEIYEIQKASVEKNASFMFEGGQYQRPLWYVGNIFKLGGILSYNKDAQKVTPDIMLMYEFLSFDRILPFHGLSLNAGVGLQHAGGTLGYQLLKTSWFKNTSIHLGYSYNFIDMSPRPILAVSLNF
jgi:hypothetical protein